MTISVNLTAQLLERGARVRDQLDEARRDLAEARAALLTVAQALGMSYGPDTGPDWPAATEAIVAHVRELQRKAGAWDDLQIAMPIDREDLT